MDEKVKLYQYISYERSIESYSIHLENFMTK